MKTKPIRAKVNDAFAVEQAARELAAELQREVNVPEVLEAILQIDGVLEDAKERVKGKTQ